MSPSRYTEDALVQKTTADYLAERFGGKSVYAHNNKDFGPESLLGRALDRELMLERTQRQSPAELNPGRPETAIDDGVRQIGATLGAKSIVAANRAKYALIRDGVPVTYRNEHNEPVQDWLRVLDFDVPENNHFFCEREPWVRGDLYRRRPDIIGFADGLSLLFIECKNIHRNLEAAFKKNCSDYRDTTPHVFHHNEAVMFGNGVKARIGPITSKWEHFHECKCSVAKSGPIGELSARAGRRGRGMNDFKGRHFRGKIMLWTVRWYCSYAVSYRDLEAMMTRAPHRGGSLDNLSPSAAVCPGNGETPALAVAPAAVGELLY